jgi:hypothetical protein
MLAASLLSCVKYPQDVEYHDESWHYEASEDHILFNEGVMQTQKTSYDDKNDSHVPTGPSTFFLQQWDTA